MTSPLVNESVQLITNRLTPDFRFNPGLGTTGRYINKAGRIAPQSAVTEALEQMIAGVKGDMVAVSQQLQAGTISLADWQLAMRDNIKIIHSSQASIAKGGWARMTPTDWGRVGSTTKRQYAFLQNFAVEIESGKQKLNGQFMRRAGMYADAGRGTAGDVGRIEASNNGLTEERRIIFPGDSCPTCIDQAQRGWQPIGTLNRIGDSECRTNCRCIFEFRGNQTGALARLAIAAGAGLLANEILGGDN